MEYFIILMETIDGFYNFIDLISKMSFYLYYLYVNLIGFQTSSSMAFGMAKIIQIVIY